MEQANFNNNSGKVKNWEFALRKKRPHAGDLIWVKIKATNESEAIKETRKTIDASYPTGYNLYAGPLEIKPKKDLD